jgi:hypothetical protein
MPLCAVRKLHRKGRGRQSSRQLWRVPHEHLAGIKVKRAELLRGVRCRPSSIAVRPFYGRGGPV